MIRGGRRDLWLVLAGRFVSGLGTNVHTVALASYVLTHHSPTVYGVVVTLSTFPLYLLVSLSACAGGLFAPASMAILPSVVARADLGRANSLAHMSDSVVRAAGPGLGGVLIAAVGAVFAFLANGCSYVLSGLSELLIREGGAVVRRCAAGMCGKPSTTTGPTRPSPV